MCSCELIAVTTSRPDSRSTASGAGVEAEEIGHHHSVASPPRHRQKGYVLCAGRLVTLVAAIMATALAAIHPAVIPADVSADVSAARVSIRPVTSVRVRPVTGVIGRPVILCTVGLIVGAYITVIGTIRISRNAGLAVISARIRAEPAAAVARI